MSNLLRRPQEQVSVETRIWKQCTSLSNANVIYSFPASLTLSAPLVKNHVSQVPEDHTCGSAKRYGKRSIEGLAL